MPYYLRGHGSAALLSTTLDKSIYYRSFIKRDSSGPASRSRHKGAAFRINIAIFRGCYLYPVVAACTLFTMNSVVYFITTLISSCCYFCPADRTANFSAAAAVLMFKCRCLKCWWWRWGGDGEDDEHPYDCDDYDGIMTGLWRDYEEIMTIEIVKIMIIPFSIIKSLLSIISTVVRTWLLNVIITTQETGKMVVKRLFIVFIVSLLSSHSLRYVPSHSLQ